jgi:hypothetical protein
VAVETRLAASLRGALYPTTTYDNVPIVENGGLAWGERSLRLVKANSDFVRASGFNRGRGWLMPVPYLHRNFHRPA